VSRTRQRTVATFHLSCHGSADAHVIDDAAVVVLEFDNNHKGLFVLIAWHGL
jgi:hypothetical protein